MTETKAGPRKRKPTHPGRILARDIEALGLTVYAAAKAMGVSQMALHNIINEKTSISPQMALRIGKWLANGPELWINMQTEHDLWVAKQAIKDELAKIKPGWTPPDPIPEE